MYNIAGSAPRVADLLPSLHPGVMGTCYTELGTSPGTPNHLPDTSPPHCIFCPSSQLETEHLQARSQLQEGQ